MLEDVLNSQKPSLIERIWTLTDEAIIISIIISINISIIINSIIINIINIIKSNIIFIRRK